MPLGRTRYRLPPFDLAELLGGDGNRGLHLPAIASRLACDVRLCVGVGKQRRAARAVCLRCDRDELAALDRLRGYGTMGAAVFLLQFEANGFTHRARIDERGLIGDVAFAQARLALSRVEQRLHFGAAAQVDLCRGCVDVRLAPIVGVGPRGGQNRHCEDQPLASPERSEDGGGVGRLVHWL